ncbi:MAG: RNA polymerase subunit sigma [Pelagimonas sp.]|jgi:RNA polymerase sigma-70 factor (ECF subfamily)|nr:RNA polymerase subunit sigma [Pelagimonas sp.]
MAQQFEIESLVSGVARGDRRSFERLYDLTAPRLLGIAVFILRDQAAAEEVLQRVYVDVWNRAGAPRPHGLTPMAWLIGLTREASVRVLRISVATGQEGMGLADGVIGPAIAKPGHPPETGTKLGAALRDALGRLPEDQAEAIQLSYLQGWSYLDLARAGIVEPKHARPWMQRALAGLRAELTDE